jgi:hypothetical protein
MYSEACPVFASNFFCGHALFWGHQQGSTGFNNDGMHISLFGGAGDTVQVGAFIPNTTVSGNFIVSTPAVLDPATLSVITLSWGNNLVELYVNGVLQASRADLVLSTPFTPSNFVVGLSENNSSTQSSGALSGAYDEFRVHPTARNAAYVRAEARAHLEQLIEYGAVESAP